MRTKLHSKLQIEQCGPHKNRGWTHVLFPAPRRHLSCLHSFFLCMNCQRYTTRWQTKRTFTWNCYSLWLNVGKYENTCFMQIRVITKLPNSEQSYQGKVKTHKYINRQNQSTTRKLWKRNDPDLVQAFLKIDSR